MPHLLPSSPLRRLLVLAALAVAATVCLSGVAQARGHKPHRRVPRDFFSVVLESHYEDPAFISDAALDQEMSLMARSGVESVRVSFQTPNIEPNPGVFNWARTDRLVATAARHGLDLLPNVIFTPAWASSHPSDPFAIRFAPRNPQVLGDIMTQLVRRYGPSGSFWSTFHGPRRPLRTWQFWNEPMLLAFWDSTPWAPTFVPVLRAAYRATHAADRGAKVVSPSLVAAGAYNQWQGMSDLYRAGGKGLFDAVTVNPFTDGTIPVKDSVARVIEIVRRVRVVMRAHGDGRKGIMITELTWPAARGFVKPSRLLGLETTARGESLRLRAAYNYLATHQRQTGVTRAYWFTWISNFNANDPSSDVGYRFAGLVRDFGGHFVGQRVLGDYTALARRYEACVKTSAGRCR